MAHAGHPRRPRRSEATASGAGLGAALAPGTPQYAPAVRAEKRRLLAALATTPIAQPAVLLQLHESLCFLQAYPDDRDILDRVDGLLAGFSARTRALGEKRLGRLRDSGVAD